MNALTDCTFETNFLAFQHFRREKPAWLVLLNVYTRYCSGGAIESVQRSARLEIYLCQYLH